MTPAEKRRKEIRKKYRDNVRTFTWSYNEKYDCYYETKSRVWVEDKCSDRHCQFCTKRPKLAPRKRSPAASPPQPTEKS